MAKEIKVKSREERRKSFIIRAVVYIALLILLTVTAILINHTALQGAIYSAALPKKIETTVGGKDMTFYTEKETIEDEYGNKNKYYSFYYYDKDENGNEIKTPLSGSVYLDENGNRKNLSFSVGIQQELIFGLVNHLLKVLIVLLLLLLVIWGIRLYRFTSGLDELGQMKKLEKKKAKQAKKKQ